MEPRKIGRVKDVGGVKGEEVEGLKLKDGRWGRNNLLGTGKTPTIGMGGFDLWLK